MGRYTNLIMKTKTFAALALIFSLLFTLCSCKTIDGGDSNVEIVTELYVVDDEGVSREVQTEVNEEGETEYYYFDNSGNVVEVESKAVKVEKKKVQVTSSTSDTGETYSMTPEQQSFVEQFNEGNIEKYVEEENVDFETGDEIAIDEEKVDKIIEEAQESGSSTPATPTRTTVTDYFAELSKNEKYYIEMNMKVVQDDETTVMPVVMARNGDKRYIELSMPVSEEGNVKAKILVLNGKCTIYIPSMKAYMEVPSEFIDEMYDNLDMATEQDDGTTFIASTTQTINGEKYDVDIYTAEDGSKVQYYYLGDELKRIECEIDNSNYSIFEYTTRTSSPADSLFKAPTGYFNMTDIFGEDFFS